MTHVNSSKIQAKSLEEQDLPAIYRLLSEPDVSEKLHWSPTFQELMEAYQLYWSQDPDEKNYLLKYGPEPVGWLKLNGFSDNKTLWISMLAIAPAYQGQHIGTWTLSFSESIAKKNGHAALMLKTTTDNQDAIAFYIRRGYRLDAYNEKQKKYTFLKSVE